MRVASIKLDPKKPIRRKRARAALVPVESRITILGHQKVIVDTALAEIYGVPVKRLNQQVRRNARRFPVDFMFQITRRQFAILKMQFATSRLRHGGRRSFPFAFTEHGAIMAATVFNSDQAVEMSVFVVRAFVRLRHLIADNKVLASKIAELEEQMTVHDGKIQDIFQAINQLMSPLPRRRSKIGFQIQSRPAV
jgi:phage regulator Rha-like protein